MPPTAAEQLLAERANMPRAYAGMTGGTRTPKPETRNPKFETRNPKLETRNLKPETRNPKP